MHLTASFCLAVLLLYKTHYAQSRPENGDDSEDLTSTGHMEFVSMIEQEISEKWSNIETINFYEYKSVGRRCKRVLIDHKSIIIHETRTALENLKDRNKCSTALDARNIVKNALQIWSDELTTIVRSIRNLMLLISNVFITYYKLMMARYQIYTPSGAAKFRKIFEETVRADKLLDKKDEKRKPKVQTLNNVVRYFSGVFNPAREFRQQLEEIDEADDFEDAKFEESLEDAIEQIETIGGMMVEIVDAVGDAAYQGLFIFNDAMQTFKVHKSVFTHQLQDDIRYNVLEVEPMNEKIRHGLRLVKNIKAMDIMFGQSLKALDIMFG